MVLSKSEIQKKYYEKNKEKIKTMRKRIEIICPNCLQTRSVRQDSKRVSDRCCRCNIIHIRKEKGDILHNLHKHPLYIRWTGMKRRCNDKDKSNSYINKNIKVCEEWNDSFLSFYEWALQNGFREDLEIDRIDNDQGYFPENCRWVSHYENMLNSTNFMFKNIKDALTSK